MKRRVPAVTGDVVADIEGVADENEAFACV
jgi:hypothetical protein